MTGAEPAALDPGNAAAEAAWNGAGGEHWAAYADSFEASLSAYREAFLDAARIGPADRVLDIGCGSGWSSVDAARLAPHGEVLGVDLSEPMLAVARERVARAGLSNVAFLRTDGQVHPFEPDSFDVAISHAGSMFFADPVAAFTNIARALRPGGRLALLVWQAAADNEWFCELAGALSDGPPDLVPPPDGPGPFALADPALTRAILDASGYAGIDFDGLRRPMRFGPTVEHALGFAAGFSSVRSRLDELDPTGRRAVLARLRATIEAHHHPDGVHYPSAMWVVTANRAGTDGG